MHEVQSSCEAIKPDLIMLDLNFGDMDGVLLLNYLSNIKCKSPTIIIGFEDERLLLAIKHIGEVKGLTISGILKKPLQTDKIELILKGLEHSIIEHINDSTIAKALEENRFDMYYQPKIHIKTKRLHGLESLIRLKHQNGDIISPAHFIPIAEKSGLIVPLTHWVIRRVFEDCYKFNNNQLEVKFAINLSPNMLHDIVFPDEIFKLAKECNVTPKHICFEVTETGVSHQSDTIMEVLTRLRLHGFYLSIDDFGTGYSSIAELQRLPFNELKIDQRFIANLHNDQTTHTIVRSTIDLGHNLGMELVAEGIESHEIMGLLEKLQCLS
jgi:EAL domain-containing protein (putative c-di-GMP-specific phosphodiesterase class I)